MVYRRIQFANYECSMYLDPLPEFEHTHLRVTTYSSRCRRPEGTSLPGYGQRFANNLHERRHTDIDRFCRWRRSKKHQSGPYPFTTDT